MPLKEERFIDIGIAIAMILACRLVSQEIDLNVFNELLFLVYSLQILKDSIKAMISQKHDVLIPLLW